MFTDGQIISKWIGRHIGPCLRMIIPGYLWWAIVNNHWPGQDMYVDE